MLDKAVVTNCYRTWYGRNGDDGSLEGEQRSVGATAAEGKKSKRKKKNADED